MDFNSIIDNAYGVNSALKVCLKCDELKLTQEATTDVLELLSRGIQKNSNLLTQNFDYDLVKIINTVCLLYTCYPGFENKKLQKE